MTYKSIKEILIDRSIPSHIQEDYPVFVEFIRAYFDWLEEQANPLDIAINLKDYRNIDRTLDDFIIYFQKELFPTIPNNIIANKRLLAKYVKDFYLNKGNESSFKLLFRLLYGESIDFYYPKEDILRSSDGKWVEQKTIKITYDRIGFANIINKEITGLTSGAKAVVENAILYMERGEDVIELTLSNLRGSFTTGEFIAFNYVNGQGNTVAINTQSVYEIVSSVDIVVSGSNYTVGDVFTIRDSSAEEIGDGFIKATTKGGIIDFTIEDGGIGYNGNVKAVTKFYALPSTHNLNGDILWATPADGSGSGTSGTDYTAYTGDEIIAEQLLAGIGDRIEIIDSEFSFGTGAFGVVQKVDTDGTILEVLLIDDGSGYTLPTSYIVTTTGTGADITVNGGGGTITTIALNSFPIIVDSDYDSSGLTVYADFTSIGEGNATGNVGTDTLAEYEGFYLNDDGHLSSTKKLQDNFFYQDFSYVIKVSRDISYWKEIVKNVLHPAGMELFGESNTTSAYDIDVEFYDTELELRYLSEYDVIVDFIETVETIT